MLLQSDESRGRFYVAREDIPAGTIVLVPTCVSEALDSSEYCWSCKAR